jgi:hypothetical protein
MARMEELSNCISLTERQAKALLHNLATMRTVYGRLVVEQVDGQALLLGHDEMTDLEARLMLALREDER